MFWFISYPCNKDKRNLEEKKDSPQKYPMIFLRLVRSLIFPLSKKSFIWDFSTFSKRIWSYLNCPSRNIATALIENLISQKSFELNSKPIILWHEFSSKKDICGLSCHLFIYLPLKRFTLIYIPTWER